MTLNQIADRACVVLLAAVLSATAPAAAEDSLVFTGGRHAHFADAHQFATIEHSFEVTNTTDAAITIVQGIALSGTGVVRFDAAPIPPGGTATIAVSQPVDDRLGTTSFRFAVVTDEPGAPKHRFSLSGFVESAYDPEVVHVDLGFIDRRVETSGEFELFSREIERLRATGTATEHPEIAISTEPTGISDEGLKVRVTAGPGLPRGILYGTATLTTNVSSQPRFTFSYGANVFDDVVPEENPVEFGLVRTGQEAITTVVVRSRSDTPFDIERATNTIGEILDISWRPCDDLPDGPSPCFVVRLSLSPEEARITGGNADLWIEGDPEPVPIRVNSWVVSPEAVVKHIDLAGSE